jgi:hypothetical protein
MKQYNVWSKDDDNQIVDLFLDGNNFNDISFIVNENTSFIKKRLIVLAKDSIKNGTATIDDMAELLGVNKNLLK